MKPNTRSNLNTSKPIRQRVAGGETCTLSEIVTGAIEEAHGTVYLCESSRDPYALEQLPGVSIYAAHVPRDYPLGQIGDQVKAAARIKIVRDCTLDPARTLALVEAIEKSVRHLRRHDGTIEVLEPPPFGRGRPRADAYIAILDGTVTVDEENTVDWRDPILLGFVTLHPLMIGRPDPYAPLSDEEEDPGLQQLTAFIDAHTSGAPIIDGLLNRDPLTFIFGKWGMHKSRIAMDLAFHVALNRSEWHGRKLYLQGPVAMLLGEGEGTVRTRAQAFAKKHAGPDGRPINLTAVPFYARGGVNLEERANREKYLAELDERRPVLVVIDTLAASSGDLDENTADMKVVVRFAQDVHRRIGASVLIVHHSGHSNTDRMRGWSGLYGAADGVLRVKQAKGGSPHQVVLECRKIKGGDLGKPIRLKAELVPLGADPNIEGRQIADRVMVVEKVDPDTATLDVLRAAVEAADGRLAQRASWDVVAEARDTSPKSAGDWIRRKLLHEGQPSNDAVMFNLRLEEDGTIVDVEGATERATE